MSEINTTTEETLAPGFIRITANAPKVGKEDSIIYEMPETVAGLVEKFGEAEIAKAASSALVVKIQAAIRRALETGRDVQELVNWMPGMVFGGSEDPIAVVMRNLDKLAPEERAKLLSVLQG